MNTVEEPLFSEWEHIFKENLKASDNLRNRLTKDRIVKIRKQLIDSAQAYVNNLSSIAAECGVQFNLEVNSGKNNNEAVIMAGHQPIIYHYGLLYKNTLLSRLSRNLGITGINVVIDTDRDESGSLMFPIKKEGELSLIRKSINTKDNLMRDQKILPASEMRLIWIEVAQGLNSAGMHAASELSKEVCKMYCALEGQSVAAANSIARAQFEHRSYLEIPLSNIVTIPEISDVISEWIDDHKNLVNAYNTTLDVYRNHHKIKNRANPFPNMKVDDGRIELPIWAIDAQGTRESISMPSQRTTDHLLVPRGGLVTLLLRAFCSDLFIHGVGGGRYDPFVDRLALTYYGVNLPRFVVASETRYLFVQQAEQIDKIDNIKSQYKEIVSHTERFLGCGLFTVGEEQILSDLASKRPIMLQRLQNAQDKESRSQAAHELNALNRDIKGFIDQSSLARNIESNKYSENTKSVVKCREFPCFFFPKPGPL